jgi:hypothetical protein
MGARDSYSLESTPKSRPLGVTIIAILNIIGGVIMLIFGIGLVILGAVLPTLPPSVFNQSLFGGVGIAFGAVLVALAIVSFIVAYGLLKGRGWAWTVTLILSIISIVWNAITIATAANFGGIISIIISAVIIYYLYRPHVKAYFGKGVSPSPPAA